MSYDDGEPLIDARSARVKRTGRKSAAPPVTRPGILKSKAAALREIDEATRGDEEAAEAEGEAEDDDGRSRRERRDGERAELTSTASVVEWMVRSTDDMLDDLEAREPPGAVAAWALDGAAVGGRSFRHFRVRQTGKNAYDSDGLHCAGIELYGRLATSE